VDGLFGQVVDSHLVGFACAHGPLTANELGRSFPAGLNCRLIQVPILLRARRDNFHHVIRQGAL
jgi:hypothetical protein